MPDFGRVFLMLNYTDITQNTYVQSRTVTEIMAREKCGLLAVSKYCTPSVTSYLSNAPARSKRHGNAVTLACALQHGSSDVTRYQISCSLRKVLGSLRTIIT